MSYRVLIPTAGTGSRLGKFTAFINKSLVGIANRPTISHIIEQFPNDTEFVIALGHKGNLVREFLSLAYPKRKFFFAEVSPFEGEGSGLGLSILVCKEYLQQPFIFTSCDTLVRGSIPDLSENWMGYANISRVEQYRTLKIQNNNVVDICEKGIGKIETHKPYIGLAGINDYQTFWLAMKRERVEAIAIGESHGMRHLLKDGIKAHCFTWFDTGNPETLAKTRKVYRQPHEPNILEKANEAIWFVDGKVIKFSDDTRFIANRVNRTKQICEFVPEVTGATEHMFRYNMEEGKVLSDVIDIPVFEKFLQYSKSFWKEHNLDAEQKKIFQSKCMRFYRDKTLDRVELFYKIFDRSDGTQFINGKRMPTLSSILKRLDWKWLSQGLAGRFHGDFHFENIIFTNNKEFKFLDWRQEFGGSLITGDIYYDFAKLLHGLIISHEIIVNNNFWIDWQQDKIRFDFHRKQILVECEKYLFEWLSANGYERKKVWVLTALIFLNIAALHHYPYSLLLYGLGKQMLSENSKD